jgi:hypothetical protein
VQHAVAADDAAELVAPLHARARGLAELLVRAGDDAPEHEEQARVRDHEDGPRAVGPALVEADELTVLGRDYQGALRRAGEVDAGVPALALAPCAHPKGRPPPRLHVANFGVTVGSGQTGSLPPSAIGMLSQPA